MTFTNTDDYVDYIISVLYCRFFRRDCEKSLTATLRSKLVVLIYNADQKEVSRQQIYNLASTCTDVKDFQGGVQILCEAKK